MEFDHSECNRGKSKQICNRPDKDLQPDSFELNPIFTVKPVFSGHSKRIYFLRGFFRKY